MACTGCLRVGFMCASTPEDPVLDELPSKHPSVFGSP